MAFSLHTEKEYCKASLLLETDINIQSAIGL